TVDGRVIVPAAWVRLEIDTRDLVAVSQPIEQARPLELAVRVSIRKTVAALEHFARTGDATARELGAEQTVARGLAWMNALYFRPVVEILADAACEAAREPERVVGLRRIELQQARRARRGAEHAGKRRVVKAALRRD